MSLIKRFALREKARVEGSSLESDGAIETSQSEQQPEPTDQVDLAQTSQAATILLSPESQVVQPGSGSIKRMKQSVERQKTSHRAALDFLNILKSLAPVFKAVSIYPGHEAPADQIAVAVRRLSETSVNLAEFIATNGDALEIDSAWARKTLHEFTADLVSNYWISTVIAKGGSAGMPEISAEFFKPAIRSVMALPVDVPKHDNSLRLSFTGAIQLSLLKGLTPIEIEIERFATFLSLHVPGSKVSTADLLGEISQFLMEQALIHHDRFLQENPDASEDDRRVMLQALIGHAATVILSAWEYCKGEVYFGVSEAKSSQAALDFLAQDHLSSGFPLQILKNRTEESLRRLVGAASCALSMMRRQAEEPRA